MFTGMNRRCAHQRRPRLKGREFDENEDTSRQVVDGWPTALSPAPFEKRPPKRINATVRLLCRSGEKCNVAVRVHAFLRLRPYRWAFSSPGPALIKALLLRNQAP